MAGDMRLLAAILEIVTELERMGDYAKGIARVNLMIGEEPLIKPTEPPHGRRTNGTTDGRVTWIHVSTRRTPVLRRCNSGVPAAYGEVSDPSGSHP
jgi:hypothetical protein